MLINPICKISFLNRIKKQIEGLDDIDEQNESPISQKELMIILLQEVVIAELGSVHIK